MKAIKYISCVLLLSFQLILAQTFSWDKINSLYGGEVSALMKDSVNSIYSGTYKGIYQSTDFTNSWKYISNKFDADELTFINQNYFLCSYGTEAVYSADQGISWDSLISSPYGMAISCIHVRNNNLYLGTGQLTFLFSSDMGNSWEITNLNSIFPPYSYDFISAFEVVNDSILFVGSDGNGLFIVPVGSTIGVNINFLPPSIFDFEQSDSNKIYCGTSNGIYISTDTGWNWALVGIEERKIYSFKRNNNYFFAGTDSGMYISTDNGLNWESKSFENISPTIYDILIIDSDKLCAATSFGVYMSSDNGNTWNQNNYGVDAVGSIYDIFTKGDTIYLASRSGFFRSFDNGQSWERKGAGLNQDLIISITLDRSANIYAGTNTGVFKSIDYGKSWNNILSGTYLRNVAAFNDILFAAKAWNSLGTGIYRSSDHGLSWQIIPDIDGTINSFCLLPNNHIMAGGDNLYISSDIGITWNQLQSPVWGGGEITELNVSSNNIYLGSDIAGLFVSSDLGNNWSYLGFEWNRIGAIEVYHDSIFISACDGPFLSTDKGVTWLTINQGLSDNCIITFCFDSRGYLLAGTTDGLYISAEIIATNVKRQTSDFPVEFSLTQNHPNPFNPTTTIKYRIPRGFAASPFTKGGTQGDFVSLKVYDVLGNEIATLVDEEKPPGSYEVEFDASGITSGISAKGRCASGVYFYQLRAGSFIETKKMILMK